MRKRGRQKAGHGWSAIFVNDKIVPMLMDAAGRWVTTYTAQAWPRCTRCRTPEERSPFGSGLCSICFFYKGPITTDEFWRIHKAGYPLAPYNIGHRLTGLRFRNPSGSDVNWRRSLREEIARHPSIDTLLDEWHAANLDFVVRFADGTTRRLVSAATRTRAVAQGVG